MYKSKKLNGFLKGIVKNFNKYFVKKAANPYF